MTKEKLNYLKIVVLILLCECFSLAKASEHLPRADFATFWGGFNRVFSCSAPAGEIRKIEVPNLKEKVKIYISTKKKPAPLFVIYPGVFAEVNHKMVFHMAEQIEKLNVHVIVLPNLAASSYLGNRKATRDNPWEEEQAAQKNLLVASMKEIDSDLITSFHILGESLGVWQAIMMLEVSPKPIASMTLMWPPLNLGESLNRFDKLLIETRTTYLNCSFWWKWPYVFLNYKREHLPKVVPVEDELCYGSFILQEAFAKGIRNVTKESFKIKKMKIEKYPETFNDFAKISMNDLAGLLNHKRNLLRFETWIPVFKKMQLKPFIYTSKDDFLNDESEWLQIKNDSFFRDRLTIYTWGGHSGRASEPEFWDDLRSKINNI